MAGAEKAAATSKTQEYHQHKKQGQQSKTVHTIPFHESTSITDSIRDRKTIKKNLGCMGFNE